MDTAKEGCIIHRNDVGTSSKLVSPRGIISWNTLLEAAKTRQHKPVLDVAENLQDGEIPPVLYHRQCRSIFTMKKTLDAIEKQRNTNLETDRNDECTRLSTCQIATSARRTYEVQCIFCEKKHKFLKGQKTRESLVQCRELDTRILAVVSRYLVAAEAHYHRSCYRSYTREEKVSSNKVSESNHSNSI